MEALLCILTLGLDCGWVDDNRHRFNEPRQEQHMAPAVPEPGAALLFGTGLVIAGIAARREDR